MDLEQAKDYILSDNYISEILNTNKWVENGSEIMDYFYENSLMHQYANTKEKKLILSKYIKERLTEFLENLDFELQDKTLYRSIYLKEKPENKGKFGNCWSSRSDTYACTSQEYGMDEYILEIDYNEEIIDWERTLKSRIDFMFGEREKEFFIKDIEISLKSFTIK